MALPRNLTRGYNHHSTQSPVRVRPCSPVSPCPHPPKPHRADTTPAPPAPAMPQRHGPTCNGTSDLSPNAKQMPSDAPARSLSMSPQPKPQSVDHPPNTYITRRWSQNPASPPPPDAHPRQSSLQIAHKDRSVPCLARTQTTPSPLHPESPPTPHARPRTQNELTPPHLPLPQNPSGSSWPPLPARVAPNSASASPPRHNAITPSNPKSADLLWCKPPPPRPPSVQKPKPARSPASDVPDNPSPSPAKPLDYPPPYLAPPRQAPNNTNPANTNAHNHPPRKPDQRLVDQT